MRNLWRALKNWRVVSLVWLNWYHHAKVSQTKSLRYSCTEISALQRRHDWHKILHGICDTAVSPDLPICQDSVARGNNCKLVKNFSRYDIRKYFFTESIINIWNSLPSHVVNSSSLNSFMNNLDKFWTNQEAYSNFKCDITRTQNRSVWWVSEFIIICIIEVCY